jgi:cytochrome P450
MRSFTLGWNLLQGHDTTASAIVWFLYCMAVNPKHQVLNHQANDIFKNN